MLYVFRTFLSATGVAALPSQRCDLDPVGPEALAWARADHGHEYRGNPSLNPIIGARARSAMVKISLIPSCLTRNPSNRSMPK